MEDSDPCVRAGYSPDETRPSKLIVDVVVASGDRVDAVEIDKEDFIRSVSMDHRKILEQTPAGLRGFSITVKENVPEEETDPWDFSGIVTAYRHLLSKPYLTRSEEETLDDLSRKLYSLLISPIEKYIEGKSDLLIIPEGILAYLPFETLLMPDGKYLIEKYNIRYTQSLTVSEMIERRSGLSSCADDYPILAFGGAVYNTQSYQTDMLVSERHFDTFKEETLAAMEKGMSSRSAYETLGLGGWTNLPGTLTEVKALGNIIKGGSVFTGVDVNEAFVKKMSREGKLKQYRILHFATHGIVVPDFPELSAIVLSLNLPEKNGDDGYLTMAEIVNLDLNAEFVNLSACETGLGSLYSGEGVVGLTQAFLVAGAGGLSVSLWQVADESTMQFMIGLYKLVQNRGLSYHKAMSEMKRSFIKEDEFSRPFFWAPFVYYGN